MRIPKSLEALADHGIIQEVLRPLMSGKEAQIYLVVSDGQYCAAKIYKEAQNRSFKNRADYTEGRKVRNTRDQRAMSKGTKYGKSQDEDAWKSTEVEMIYRLRDAGVRVPAPYTYIDGVLLMELVTDYDGNPASRLGDLQFTREEATRIYHHLIREVSLMLCAGIVHGDLSEFNVLMSADGPVIIDFPQSVNAAGNLNARTLLIRDVNNLHRFLARWVPGARPRPYAEEMWALYEANTLSPETQLTGSFKRASGPVDTRAVLELIGDANRDELKRREALGQSTVGLKTEVGLEPEAGRPAPRRREVIIEKPAPRRREVIVDRPAPRGGAMAGSPNGTRSPRPGGSQGPRPGGSQGPRPGASQGSRLGGASHAGARHDGAPPTQDRRPDTRPGAPKPGPKRGDNVQASTYVSPEARKVKVKALTPRLSAQGAQPAPQQAPRGEQKSQVGQKPGAAAGTNGEQRRPRSRRRRGPARSNVS